MSKELIERMRSHADAFMGGVGGLRYTLLEAADALEAKAAPVGEREAQRAAIEAEFEPLPYDADQRDIDRRNRVEKPCFARGFTAGYQAGAAYQRAQQPQSAEAVAWTHPRHLAPTGAHVFESTRGRVSDAQVPLYTTPQPSAGVVMPELPPFAQKVISKLQRFQECAEDGEDTDIGRHWLDLLTQLALLNRVQRSPALWEISQQGDDVLARLNGKEVGRG